MLYLWYLLIKYGFGIALIAIAAAIIYIDVTVKKENV